jgi:hypothetical protein
MISISKVLSIVLEHDEKIFIGYNKSNQEDLIIINFIAKALKNFKSENKLQFGIDLLDKLEEHNYIEREHSLNGGFVNEGETQDVHQDYNFREEELAEKIILEFKKK